MERSFLYVSRRQATEADIRDIVDAAHVRNVRLNVTGALIATDGRFAQILEGSRAAIDELMESIRRDRRHTQVHVVQDRDAPRRDFADWSIAYSGGSLFVDGLIGALATGSRPEPDRHYLRRLLAFMREFARAPR